MVIEAGLFGWGGLGILKFPLITDKTTQQLEKNQFSFAVAVSANKYEIKAVMEEFFDVPIFSVNTSYFPIKKCRLGKNFGTKPRYKKAIVTVANYTTLNLFAED